MLIRTPRDLGAAIRDHRRRRGLGQQELAEKINASRQWVVEVEKGKARAQIGLVLRAFDALGIALVLDPDVQAGGKDGDADLGFDIDRIVDEAREKDG